ncbi:hypothetical protein JCM9279_006686 [Rhodotorula babjevae]
MSVEPHKYWPSVGSIYSHWSDLLLATQLAAARAGFTYIGRSFKQPQPDRKRPDAFTLRPSDTITGWRKLHTLEGALRAQSRREGRFLACRAVSLNEASPRPGFQINRALSYASCDLLIRLEGVRPDDVGGETWRCVEIRSQHSCISSASPANEKLKWRLDWWVTLVNGCVGKPMRQQAPRKLDDHEATLTVPSLPAYRSSSPPLMPALADADSSDSPTSLAALLPDRQALASAEKDLADTSTAVDELKSKLAVAEKRADVQRKRVEKKRAKLQRRLERERSKRVVEEGPRSKDKKRDLKRAGERKKKAEMLVLSD